MTIGVIIAIIVLFFILAGAGNQSWHEEKHKKKECCCDWYASPDGAYFERDSVSSCCRECNTLKGT